MCVCACCERTLSALKHLLELLALLRIVTHLIKRGVQLFRISVQRHHTLEECEERQRCTKRASDGILRNRNTQQRGERGCEVYLRGAEVRDEWGIAANAS